MEYEYTAASSTDDENTLGSTFYRRIRGFEVIPVHKCSSYMGNTCGIMNIPALVIL